MKEKNLLATSELKTDAEINNAFPLMSSLRARVDQDTFCKEVRRQQIEGYRLYGGFLESGELVVLAGVRRTHTLARGEHLFVDDLVTQKNVQGNGYGKSMLRWLAGQAQLEGLSKIYLDSRDTARGFYEKSGFNFFPSIPCMVEIEKMLR